MVKKFTRTRASAGKKNVHEVTFRLQLSADKPSEFMILFLCEGEANGWTFSRQVLEESIGLWEGCSVFVDHAMFGRSVRDLGAVIHDVQWSDKENGLIAHITPEGPSKEIVLEAANYMTAEGARPDVGFSADVIFTADALNNVQKIMQPLSVDLVIDPAFATKFIRQLNQKGRSSMKKQFSVPPDPPDEEEEDTEKVSARTREVSAATMKAETDAAHETRLAMGNQLLEVTLSNSDLPAVAQAAIQVQFEGKAFKPADLTAAVKNMKEAIAEVTAPSEIQGPTRINAMFDSRDQLQAAIDDLVGAPREPGAEKLKVAKFNGVKEAYIHMTGDREMVGGYFKDHVQFQATTATFPGLVANALNKALVQEWAALGRAGYDWWTKIVKVEHFNSVNDIKWMLFGTIQSLPTVAEGAEYTELKIGDGYEASSFVKRGGYIGITLEALDRDDTRKLRAIPRELANAGLREISAAVAAIFTVNSAIGPLMTDGGYLFNATAVTTAGGHKNLLTAAIGTDYTAWDAAAKAMFVQPMLVANETGYIGTGKYLGVDPKYCLIPRALKAAAEAIFVPRWASAVQTIASVGGPTYGGIVEPVVVPDWTDVTDWAAVADPAICPAIMIGERFGLVPQIFVAGNDSDPAMFANDESRIKVRHFIAVGVADFRPLAKNNVAG